MAKTIINRYYSLDAFLTECTTAPEAAKDWGGRFCPHTDTAARYIRKGATEAQQQWVRDMLTKIDSDISGREKRELIPVVAGGSVNVPDFLQGKPRCMRRRTLIESDVAPVRVVVETTVSGGTSDSTIAVRGAAVAALVMRLSETRPVELWAVNASQQRGKDFIGFVQVGVHPISLASVTAVLTSTEFARGCMLTAALKECGGEVDDHIGWGWGIGNATARCTRMRDELSLAEQDILVPGGHLSEQNEIIRNPVAWVNKYLDPQREL